MYICKMRRKRHTLWIPQTEVDIWLKVVDKLVEKHDFKFIDEFCGPNGVNYLKYKRLDEEYSIYFDRKTETVEHLFKHDNGFFDYKTTKQSFYNQYIDVFRDIKLEYLT